MIVEIIGIYDRNKGAVLMLEAVRAQLKERELDARLAVPVTMPRAARRQLSVLGVLPRHGRKAQLLNRLPSRLLQRFGLVRARDVQVILDASGFAYGDYWGETKLRTRLLRRLEGWKSADRVAVLLPQALGPFGTSGIAAGFRRVLDLLDLAFVRDAASLDHVRRLGDSAAVRSAPDFTNLLHPPLPPRYAALAGSSFLIPNEKMIAGDRARDRDIYIDFMVAAADALRASGRTPRLLVHEGEDDRRLAAAINARLIQEIEVVDAPSALDTKALIGAAELIVSSRFHGLVSALAAGVPALACGWSHKYRELMSDYGCADQIVDLHRPGSWAGALGDFLAAAQDPAFRVRLEHAADRQRVLSRAMWDETIGLIRGLDARSQTDQP